MIPLSDDNPQISTPVVNYALIIVNVLVFWLSELDIGIISTCDFILLPGDIFGHPPPPDFIERCGGPTLGFPTLLTSAFLHADFLHLAGNMWFLYIFGNNVEDIMGRFRYFIFFVVSAIFCGGIYAAFSDTPALGASGAVCAVMAAYYWTYPKAKINMFFPLGVTALLLRIPSWMLVLYHVIVNDFIELQVFTGASDGTAHLAHLAGYVIGFFLTFPMTDKRLLSLHPYAGWNAQIPDASPPISTSLKIVNYSFFAAAIVLILEIMFW